MSNKQINSPSDVSLPRKRTTGDTLKDRLTDNAYHNIIPARYLHQDENGDVTEEPEDLFERVAKNVALAEVLHSDNIPEDGVEVTPDQIKDILHDEQSVIDDVFGEGVSQDDDVTVTLTEENVKYFSYDNVVPELSEAAREDVAEVRNEFQDMMENLSFTPNSPTLMNAGLELQQLSACFVMSPEDDLEHIHDTAKRAALVFQSGGGCGYGFWNLRPYGDPVAATGGIASGPITFMETYDQMCETIAQGGKRRGAQMGIMRVSHPDVIEFIHSKNKDVSLAHTLRLNDPDDFTHNSFGEALEEARELITEDGEVPEHLRNAVEGHLSNFNISVGITDDFMDALQNGEEFTFTSPRSGEPHIATRETKEMYSRYGLSEYVEVGEELSIPAEEIWQGIIDGSYENGEPGVVFLERTNKQHSFDVEEHPDHQILATNPCGEQPLEEYEACNLGHINLSTLADMDAPDWRVWSEGREGDLEELVSEYLEEAIDWDELNHRVKYGTHFLDNVVTMSDFPVDKISETVADMRKVGLGIMGLAQLYIQLGLRYGSEESNEFARQVMTHINQKSKEVSHNLAKDRGSFSDWDESKYKNPTEYKEWFEKQTGEDAEDWEDGYPIRNHNTTTIAPTGTTSMVGNTTGGCEPVYNVAFYKNVSEDIQGEEMLVEFDDYFLRTLEANDIDVDPVKREAQEQMAANEFDGVDSLDTVPDAIGELFVTTDDLSPMEHASIQCNLQDGVDSAISKTVNAPNETPKEDVDDVFRYIYENGGKGVTFYRDGTRSKQVLTTRADNTEFSDMSQSEAAEVLVGQIEDIFGGIDGFLEHEDVRREVSADASSVLADDDPMVDAELFAKKAERPEMLPSHAPRIQTGYGKMYVQIGEHPDTGRPFELFATIGNSGGFTNSFTEALAKTISTALRAGVDPEEIASELRGIRSPKVAWHNGEKVKSIPDAIGLALEQYIEKDISVTYTDDDDGQDRVSFEDAVEETKEELSDSSEMNEEETEEKPKQEADDSTGLLIQNGESPECPDCNGMNLYYSEGCKTCEDCGWSEC